MGAAWCARVLAVAGFVVLAVSVPLPFASNEAGGSDHYDDAGRWYVWVPFPNIGMPLLLIGVVLLVLAFRSLAGRRVPRLVAASACGWLGLFILYVYAPRITEEMLYGGPEVELLATRWVVAVGWLVAWSGTMAFALATGQATNQAAGGADAGRG